MSIALAVITLLSGIVALVAWWLKRKRAPTKDEQLADIDTEYNETIEEVHRLRGLGRNADADSVLRRLMARAMGGRVSNPATRAIVQPDAERERLGGKTGDGSAACNSEHPETNGTSGGGCQ